MASAITHFVVGAGLALPAMDAAVLRGVLPRWAIPVTAGAFAAAPDLDTYAMLAFEIERGSFFSHRGFFHSPFFLAILAGAVAAMVTRGAAWRRLALLWAGAAITHPLLDMLTDGGSGVMLLGRMAKYEVRRSSVSHSFCARSSHPSPASLPPLCLT